MESLTERKEKAGDALARLHEVVIRDDLSDLERDGLIQRFEFCFEILWKCAKDYLREVEGIDAASPKNVIRMSRNVGLLTDEETEQALAMVNDRNSTSHMYDENMAVLLADHIKEYETLMQRWYQKMNEKDATQE